MQQAFKIENYRFIKNNNILVYIQRDKITIPITIPKEQYEVWLLTAQRLITVMVLNEPGNDPKEIDTVMSRDEYWKLPDSEIHADLYDFIISHPIIFRGSVYNNPIVSINYAFNNHRARLN